MATYGRFETVETLHQGMLTTVSTAVLAGRRAGAGRPPYIVKLFDASRGLDIAAGGEHDVYICFDPADAAVAKDVALQLEAKGARCRLAPRDGKTDDATILDDVQASQTFVVIVSPAADKSAAVGRETGWAASTGLTIHALRLGDVQPTGQLEQNLPTARWVDAGQNPPDAGDLEVLLSEVLGDVRGRGGAGGGASGGTTTGREALRASEFLDIAKLQQSLNEKGAKHWAPIHEVGTSKTGPFYVTDNYTRTAQRLITYRVAQRSSMLYNIIHSVLCGLDELKRNAGRAHGNLKPSNVLLTRRRRRWQVVLSDPGATSFSTPDAEAADLRCVGELIYQLVLHTKTPSVVQSVAESDEWTRLGRKGEQWRELCNTLLNPPRGARRSLAEVLEDVEQFRPKTKRIRVAVFVPLAVIVLITAYLIPRYYKDRALWRDLEAQEGWLQDIEPYLRSDGADEPEKAAWRRQIENLSKDDHLIGIVRKWEDPAGERSRDKLPLTPQQVRDIKTYPPFSPTAMKAARAALTASGELRGDLERWPKVLAIRSAADEFAKQGWTKPADQLRASVDLFAKRPMTDINAVGVHESITSTWKDYPDIKGLLDRVNGYWRNVQDYKQELSKSGDSVLTKYPGSMDLSTAFRSDATPYRLGDVRQGLDELELALKEVASRGTTLVAFYKSPKWGQIDQPKFAMTASHKITGTVTADTFDKWIAEFKEAEIPQVFVFAPGYQPTELIAARKAFTQLKSLATRARELPPDASPQPVDLQKRDKRLSELEVTFRDLARPREPGTPVGPLMEQKKALEADIAQALADVTSDRDKFDKWAKDVDERIQVAIAKREQEQRELDARASAEEKAQRARQMALEQRRDQAVTLIQQTSDAGLAGSTSPNIQSAWQARLAALSADQKKNPQPTDKLKPLLDELAKRYLELETNLPPLALADRSGAPSWYGDASAVLRDVFAADREARLATYASSTIAAGDGRPVDIGHKAWTEFLASAADWKKQSKNAQDLLDGFAMIDERIAEGYVPNEPDPDNQTLVSLRAKWGADKLLEKQANGRKVSDALQPVLDPLNQLMALANADPAAERQGLKQTVQNAPKLAVSRTAWLKLHESTPPWPNTPAELDEEFDLRRALLAQADSIDKPVRKQAISKSIRDENLAVSRAFFDRASKPNEITIALASLNNPRATRYGYKDVPDFVRTLDKRMRFNFELLQFRSEINRLSGETPASDVKAKIAGFKKRVLAQVTTDTQQAAAERAYFEEQLQPFDELLNRQPGAATPTPTPVPTAGGKDGPAGSALTKWTQRADAQGTLTFTGPGGRTLTFAPLPGTKTYVGTEEVSVGLFLDVARASNKQKEFRDLMAGIRRTLAEDQRKGPRVWEWEEGATATALTVSGAWFRSDPKNPPPPLSSPEPLRPTADHPMQYLTARAATFLSRVLNCRLPTPGEWTKAYQADRAASTTPTWNLPDRSAGGPLASFVYANNGAFKPSKPVAGGNIQQRDDGLLLFSTVSTPTGEPFHNIVGNVAEYVFDITEADYKKLEQMDSAGMKSAFQQYATAGKLYVVGGSALTDPNVVPFDTPQPLKQTDLLLGFSDVGMRLAFDASGAAAPQPPPPVQDKPVELLAALKELVGDNGLALAVNR